MAACNRALSALTRAPRLARRAAMPESDHQRVWYDEEGKGLRSAKPRPIRKTPEMARRATATPPTYVPRATDLRTTQHTHALKTRNV